MTIFHSLKITAMRARHVAIISGVAVVIGSLFAYLSLNTQFTLVMPDNAELHNATLSSDNFSRLKQNVGVFTVYQPHGTTQNVTISYCRIAKFIHEHEDGYNNTRVGNTTIYNATMPPAWCNQELYSVPEFSMPVLILSFGVIVLLAFMQRMVK